MSIQSQINRLSSAKSALAASIANKGVAVPANATLDDMPALVDAIEQGGSGGGVTLVMQKDVNFYDYDGTVLYGYTVAEAQALTELPPLPSHDGLICQGWNFDLATIKTHNRALNVGAMYITDDGKTRLHIHVWSTARPNVPLYISQTVSNGITIDWGDGSTTETISGTGNVSTTHQYQAPGEYIIALAVADGCTLGLGHGNTGSCVMGNASNSGKVYCNMLQSVNIGTNITTIPSYAFYYCISLLSVTIPNSVTSIGGYVFEYCYSLLSLTIPDSVIKISSYTFTNCVSLSSVAIPNGVANIGSTAFSSCSSLASITIPDSTTSIGQRAFASCNSLVSITIPDAVTIIYESTFSGCDSLANITLHDSITSIYTSIFTDCKALRNITLPSGITSISKNTFQNCYSISNIIIPDGVISIDQYAFSHCDSLSSVTIPDSVTLINNYAFSNCLSLSNITIPASVTYIKNNAFISCNGMAEYHIKRAEPPTLGSTNAFNGIPDDCIIYVPAESLEAYKTATNWSKYASYMRGE